MASATRSTIRSRLRDDLQDSSAAIWTDSELNTHLDHAARELSAQLPRERATTLTTTNGSRTVVSSSLTDCIAILAVEWPTGASPKTFPSFSYFGATLELNVTTAPSGVENVNVYWLSPHTLDDSTSTIPPHLEDLVLIGAGAYALLDQAVQAANAVNTGGEAASRNYEQLGKERLERFYTLLARHAKAAARRAEKVYAPGLFFRALPVWEA